MQKQENLLTNPFPVRSYFLRGNLVMFDSDLAELFEVETKDLRSRVRRNMKRFPSEFMFEPSKDELEYLRREYAISALPCDLVGSKAQRNAPLVFTEVGVAMLAGVLRSKKADQVSVGIIRWLCRKS